MVEIRLGKVRKQYFFELLCVVVEDIGVGLIWHYRIQNVSQINPVSDKKVKSTPCNNVWQFKFQVFTVVTPNKTTQKFSEKGKNFKYVMQKCPYLEEPVTFSDNKCLIWSCLNWTVLENVFSNFYKKSKNEIILWKISSMAKMQIWSNARIVWMFRMLQGLLTRPKRVKKSIKLVGKNLSSILKIRVEVTHFNKIFQAICSILIQRFVHQT